MRTVQREENQATKGGGRGEVGGDTHIILGDTNPVLHQKRILYPISSQLSNIGE